LTGPDIVYMDVALIETQAGDAYLNDELWTQVDDQVVSLEQKAALDANGFRIGQVGGVVPATLQALLTSKRTCGDPRHIQQHAGKASRLPLGPVMPVCRFQIRQDERTTPVVLEHAECALVVIPALTPDGRIRLRFTPEIRHGQATMAPRPDPDRTMWLLQKQQPTETYHALSWEVTLSRNEYLVIGGRFDRPETLGRACFVWIGESASNQRLLVVRAAGPSVAAAGETHPATSDDGVPVDQAQPLALQAAGTAIHGRKP
jgi:hypothetical protein